MKNEQIFNALSALDGDLAARGLAAVSASGNAKKVKKKSTLICALITVLLVCAAAMTAVLIVKKAEDNKTGDNNPEVPGKYPSSVIKVSVPDWYTPGEIKLLQLIPEKKTDEMLKKGDGVSFELLSYTRPAMSKTIFDRSSKAAAEKLVYFNNYGDITAGEEIAIMPNARFSLGEQADGYQIVGKIGTRYLRVAITDRENEHFFCDGQFCDIETGRFICLNHHLAEMTGVTILENDIGGYPTHYVNVRGSFDGLCFVELVNRGELTEEQKKNGDWIADIGYYLYDLDTDTLTRLPEEMSTAVTNQYYKVFNGGKYVVFSDYRGGFSYNDKLKLAVLGDDGKYTVSDLPAESGLLSLQNGSAYMTPDSRYLIYAAPVSKGTDGFPEYLHIQVDNNAVFRVCDTQTGTYSDVTGRFIAATEDSRYIVFENPEGRRCLYSLKQKTSEPISAGAHAAVLQNIPSRYEVTKYKSDRAGKYNLVIFDNLNGNTADKLPYIDAFTVVNGYLYYFTADTMTVTCRQLLPDGKSFDIPLSDEFAAAYNSHDSNYWNWSRIQVSPDGKQMIVYYESFEENYLIWVPDGEEYVRKDIPEELRILNTKYWGCRNLNEAIAYMMGAVNYDDTNDVKCAVTPADDKKPKLADKEITGFMGSFLYFKHENCRDADYSVISGKTCEFTMYVDIITPEGVSLQATMKWYRVNGRHYIDFIGYKCCEVINVSAGDWYLSMVDEYYNRED